MRNCVFTAGWLLIGLLAANICTAQESTEDPTSADIPSGRPSYLTSRVDRGEAIASHEQVEWLNLGGEQLWMGVRRAQQPVHGSMLLLAPAGTAVGDSGHLATLWRAMPRYGWHTFLVGMPAEVSADQLIKQAQRKMPSLDKFVVVCEADACLGWVAAEGALGTVATVYLNLPVQPGYRLHEVLKVSWAKVEPPGMVLQEFPLKWDYKLALAGDFELHLVPKARSDLSNSMVMRKLRGWLKRRLNAG